MRRVVITGQGTINSLGHNVPETLNAMARGQCGIAPLDVQDVNRLTIQIGAQVKNYDPLDYFSNRDLSLLDRYSQFALIAANEAVEQSGLVFHEELAVKSGAIIGTAGGGLQTQEENYRAVFEDGKNRVHPFVVPRLMNNAATSQISMKHNLLGPCFTVSTACASSNHAIGQAFQMVRSGQVDVMLAGGSETMLSFGGIKAWEGLRVLSPDGCRPFCATRNGLVQGEGAAVFVLEEFEAAKKRGAEILAEISGFAMNSDAGDIVSPSQSGASRAIKGALIDSKLNPEDVAYINAHGTGTTVNDKTETNAVKDVFGGAVSALCMSSTKSMHGHNIGATGAIELLACISVLKEQVAFPTIGYTKADPDCDIDPIPNEPRNLKAKAVISNAFAFGGLNAVIALQAV